MIEKYFYGIYCLSLAFILSACGGGSSDSGTSADFPTEDAQTRVLAISDSFGTGFGIATPWPPRLANSINAVVINNSVSGAQTNFGVNAITGLLDSEQPTHVVIMLGTNDAIRGSVSNAVSNLQQMVNIAQERNVIAIVATLAPITRSRSEDARAGQISSSIRGLAGARIADVRSAFDNRTNLIVDGVHPNNDGQQLIADIIAGQF